MKHKNFKILFTIFLDGKKIGRYGVISEIGETYRCVNAYTNATFLIDKKSAWLDLEELKFHRWAKIVHAKPTRYRIHFLETTKKLEYKVKYINTFPEKLI